MLAMVLSSMLVMVLLSHVGDGVAESCWRWRCQGDLVMA
jgi:hypothetical protein